MATISERQTFMQKFKQLWKDGQDAKLCVESRAGKAYVELRLELGEEPGPNISRKSVISKSRNLNTPARERRRERRAAARNTVVKVNDKVEETTTENNIDAEKATEVVLDDVTPDLKSEMASLENDIDAEKATEVGVDHVIPDLNSEKASFENDIDAGEAYEAATVQVVEHSIQLGQEDMDTLKNEDILTNKVETESADIDETKKEEKKAPQSSHVTIFATAIFGNSKPSHISLLEISALSTILKSNDMNIANLREVVLAIFFITLKKILAL